METSAPGAAVSGLTRSDPHGPGIARQGNPIGGGGVVTSGTFSPCLERGIGMGYVPSEHAAPGTRIEIDVRGTARPAVIESKPLYRTKGP